MLALTVALIVSQASVGAVSHPHPGVTLVRSSSAALVIADLCHAGVSVRATTYAERRATPSTWATRASVGADVAINADFFDFPAATLVMGRARGAGQDWPANKQLFEIRSSWEFGAGIARWQPNAAVAPPAGVTEVVGGHNTLIEGGHSYGPGFDGDPTVTNAHRRTAIGMSADRRTLYLFVSGSSLTGSQMVASMRAMAAEAGAPAIDVATNMDGGGSSQMYVRGVGALFQTGRLVANHLGVLAKGSGPSPNCPAPACQSNCDPGAADRVAAAAVPAGYGYWIVNADGAVASFGAASFHGGLLGTPLNQPVVAAASSPSGRGYWLAASDGGVFSFGDAGFFGSAGASPLNAPVVGMAPTPTGQGYWLVASDGGVFAYGDAGFYGSMGGQPLNAPVVGMAAAPDGDGYWLVASDGGVFAFGSAGFHGSMGGQPLNQPIVGLAATPGAGYWMVASDGGVFAFGDAGFHGSMGGQPLNQPIVGVAGTPSGGGYWLFARDGGVFTFGDAPYLGGALSGSGCDGATPLTCAQRADGCHYWEAAGPACAGRCNHGRCEAACGDACAIGQTRCGGGGVQGCGQVDGDPCLDWLPADACGAGKSCVEGLCVGPQCTDECQVGATRCDSGGLAYCDAGAGGCGVWSAPEACDVGTTCAHGSCVPGAGPVDEGPEPDASGGDVVEADVSSPDIVEPDVSGPDIVEPDVSGPDIVEPDVSGPDIVEPDVDQPDAIEPDAVQPDAIEPDAAPDAIAEVVEPAPDAIAVDTGSGTGTGEVDVAPTVDVPSAGQDGDVPEDATGPDASEVTGVDGRSDDSGCGAARPGHALLFWLGIVVFLVWRGRRWRTANIRR